MMLYTRDPLIATEENDVKIIESKWEQAKGKTAED